MTRPAPARAGRATGTATSCPPTCRPRRPTRPGCAGSTPGACWPWPTPGRTPTAASSSWSTADSALRPNYTIFGAIDAAGLATLDRIAAGGVAPTAEDPAPVDGAPALPVDIQPGHAGPLSNPAGRVAPGPAGGCRRVGAVAAPARRSALPRPPRGSGRRPRRPMPTGTPSPSRSASDRSTSAPARAASARASSAPTTGRVSTSSTSSRSPATGREAERSVTGVGHGLLLHRCLPSATRMDPRRHLPPPVGDHRAHPRPVPGTRMWVRLRIRRSRGGMLPVDPGPQGVIHRIARATEPASLRSSA